jgi:hypothetical protein
MPLGLEHEHDGCLLSIGAQTRRVRTNGTRRRRCRVADKSAGAGHGGLHEAMFKSSTDLKVCQLSFGTLSRARAIHHHLRTLKFAFVRNSRSSQVLSVSGSHRLFDQMLEKLPRRVYLFVFCKQIRQLPRAGKRHQLSRSRLICPLTSMGWHFLQRECPPHQNFPAQSRGLISAWH